MYISSQNSRISYFRSTGMIINEWNFIYVLKDSFYYFHYSLSGNILSDFKLQRRKKLKNFSLCMLLNYSLFITPVLRIYWAWRIRMYCWKTDRLFLNNISRGINTFMKALKQNFSNVGITMALTTSIPSTYAAWEAGSKEHYISSNSGKNKEKHVYLTPPHWCSLAVLLLTSQTLSSSTPSYILIYTVL